jgi:hypothetical protein
MTKLNGMQPPKYIPSCKVRSILETLDDQDRKTLADALTNDKLWKPDALATELTNRGIPITKWPINKHRQGQCSCSKI